MSTRVFTYSMPLGIIGNLSRGAGQATIEAHVIDEDNYPTVYGSPVVVDATSKKIRKMLANDTVADIVGLYVRPYPTQTVNDAVGTHTPPTSGIGNVLKRGYMVATLAGATAAAKQGKVYVRLAAGEGEVVGQFEAADDGADADVLTGAYFTGAADADGNVEIAYNI